MDSDENHHVFTKNDVRNANEPQRHQADIRCLTTMPHDILHIVWSYLGMPELYRVVSSVHSNLRSTFPTLVTYEAPPLSAVSEGKGCMDLQEYFRLPSVSRLVVSFRWMDQGWGIRKGRLGMSIHREGKAIIHHSFTEPNHPAPLHLEDRVYDVPCSVLQFCRENDEIVIWRYAGGGSSHILTVLFFRARYWQGMLYSSMSDNANPKELSWPPLCDNPAVTFHDNAIQ
ncbi:hypothetical protein ACHAXS_001837 [Conticribra weissflogii]